MNSINISKLSCLVLFFLFLQNARGITLDQIYRSYEYYPKEIQGIRSMYDGKHYTILRNNSILKFAYESGQMVDTVFSAEWLDQDIGEVSDYEFNSKESQLLLTTNKTSVYRHSSEADYLLYDLEKRIVQSVSHSGKQRLANFSSNDKFIAFVRDNNLFYVTTDSLREFQITDDGEFNKIINGSPDWVYEEEFTISRCFFWSPDGNRIAYYKFNESEVPLHNMTVYGDTYPEWYSYKYPKAGEKNAVVSIIVYDIQTGKNVEMDIGDEEDQYIPRIFWTNDNDMLSVLRLNRLQNKLELLMAEVTSGNSQVIYTDIEDKYIKEVSDDYVKFIDHNKFIIRNEKDGYLHLYLHDINGGLIRQITKGSWDIDEVIGINEKSSLIYYTSGERGSIYRDVYSINYNTLEKTRLSTKLGTSMAYFSKDFSYYILEYSAAYTPYIYNLYDGENNLIRELESNKPVQELIAEENFSSVEFFTIPTAEGFEMNSFMIKPPDFDKRKKYPVLLYVYGGPESQDVLDEWNYRFIWFQLLASKGYIIVCADNRGTDGKGEAYRKSTYMNLGKYELQDQVNAVEYMLSMRYVDEGRIGVFGWSYGGYMSLLCMTRASKYFKMGIAVAPVTTWRYYDTIYTERFMRKPQDNKSGYDDNSPINYASGLSGKLLIIHGSGDDNVHLQNTMDMSESLVQSNKQFDMHVYRNRKHGIAGGNTYYHLHKKMTEYIINNL